MKNFMKTLLRIMAVLALSVLLIPTPPVQAYSFPKTCSMSAPEIYNGVGQDKSKMYLVIPTYCQSSPVEGWRLRLWNVKYEVDVPFVFGVTNTVEWPATVDGQYSIYPASDSSTAWGSSPFGSWYITGALAPAEHVYDREGMTTYNDRSWYTLCEPYSQTSRCRTDIVTTKTAYAGGRYIKTTTKAFNNLTYLPSARSLWKNNPIGGYGKVGYKGSWTASNGSKWRVECDTPGTGRGGCRSFVNGTFNSLVLFTW